MNEKGSATILTLLVSAVILTVAIGFNWIVKEHLKAAEGLKVKAEAMMEARSTFDGLMFYILTGQLTQKEIVLSRGPGLLGVQRIPLGRSGIRLGNGIFVSIQDSSSLVSLVGSDVEPLKRLAAAVGANAETVSTLGDSFLDWTDPDDLSRLNGAESSYYRFEGKPYGPRNFPLQYKEELALVRGMDADLYAKMAPYLTVLPSLGFNPNTADDVTLMAYLDIDEDALGRLKDYMAQTAVGTEGEILTLTGKPLRRQDLGVYFFPSPFFEIAIEVGSPRVLYRLHAGVDVRPKPISPYGVVYWTEG